MIIISLIKREGQHICKNKRNLKFCFLVSVIQLCGTLLRPPIPAKQLLKNTKPLSAVGHPTTVFESMHVYERYESGAQ